MAYRNKHIINPKTGQQIKFILTGRETKGCLLEMESTWGPRSAEPPLHYHPSQTEYFTVLHGELTVRMDGRIRLLHAGDKVQIPPRKAHAMWNNSNDITVVNWKIMPAMNTDQLLETGMGLASDGKVNKKGMPCFLQSVLIAKKFAPVFRLSTPPYFMQRILFFVLAPVAWIAGYRATYRKYID